MNLHLQSSRILSAIFKQRPSDNSSPKWRAWAFFTEGFHWQQVSWTQELGGVNGTSVSQAQLKFWENVIKDQM